MHDFVFVFDCACGSVILGGIYLCINSIIDMQLYACVVVHATSRRCGDSQILCHY